MATLAEFRTKYPQYNDMPDVELADSLHQKFYSDIPRPQFFQQLDIVGAQLPGSEKTISLPKAQPSIMFWKCLQQWQRVLFQAQPVCPMAFTKALPAARWEHPKACK